ncbi:hypothetical protein C8R47DRAFT_1062792 [Mycena vitilis]|nr:hypothetical protein C8R47DRAFT_1062792 [Mycena vitilis]
MEVPAQRLRSSISTAMLSAALPGDVVSEIALQYIHPSRSAWLKAHEDRYTMSSVSRGWHAAVYSTPSLWHNVVVHPAMHEEYIEFCFRQARGNLDLSILHGLYDPRHAFGIRQPLSSFRTRPIEEFISSALPHLKTYLPTARSLSIFTAQTEDWHRIAVALAPLDGSCIETVCHAVGNSFSRPPPYMPTFPGSPQLRSVSMLVVPPVWVDSSLYNRLTTLDLVRSDFRLTWPLLRSVLSAAVRLLHLALDGVACNVPPDAESVSMTHLQTLRFAYQDNASIATAALIHMPAVEAIRIEVTETASLSQLSIANPGMFATTRMAEFYGEYRIMTDLLVVMPELIGADELDLRGCGRAGIDALLLLTADQGLRMARMRSITVSQPASRDQIHRLYKRWAHPQCEITTPKAATADDPRTHLFTRWKVDGDALSCREVESDG